MSFLSSMQQYVTSGISSLGLGNRRFSMSRQESSEQDQRAAGAAGGPAAGGAGSGLGAAGNPPHIPTGGYPGGGVVIGNPNATNVLLGYPKVLPAPGLGSSTSAGNSPLGVRRPSRQAECLVPPPPRSGSFRQSKSPVHQMSAAPRAPLAFCKRRLSWPEVDNNTKSGVHETDNSYFETFLALTWKSESRRISASRVAETRADASPIREHEQLTAQEVQLKEETREKLYIEILHTITNTVGAPGGQYTQMKDEMFVYAQRAFGISQDRHYQLLNAAVEDKPKIIVLTVIVTEAEGLEAKDANGFSDPYCMLGIQPGTGAGGPPPSPSPLQLPSTPRTLGADVAGGCPGSSPFDQLPGPGDAQPHRKSSFRLSFKRRDGGRREHRDSLSGAVPAKFIRATTIKQHTLTPKWNEKFQFDIDDIQTDTFHLDIWDHDDESCVMDAVSRLNEVRGVRGLGRFFKQVCQSARQGSQDDFLGCVNIPVCEIPSTGMEGWFTLAARSHRSTVQGRIYLKLWLSTREETDTSDGSNVCETRKMAKVISVFMEHEVATQEPSWAWSGELPTVALNIVHQLAVQADLSDLQRAMAKFVAATELNRTSPLDPKLMQRLLGELEKNWIHPQSDPNHIDLEEWLSQSFVNFVELSLYQIQRHREIFPALHRPSLIRLEFTLRCLSSLNSMRIFRAICPFSKGVRGEIVNAVRKGSIAWGQHILRETQKNSESLATFISTLTADIQMGQVYYHSIFDNTNGIQYFSIIYKQFDMLIGDVMYERIENCQIPGMFAPANDGPLPEGDNEPVDIRPFELYMSLQEFANLRRFLSVQPEPPEKLLSLSTYHEWFLPVFRRWMSHSKLKAMQRVQAAIELDQVCEGERVVRYSTSAVDTALMLMHIRTFWNCIVWPDPKTGMMLEAQLLDIVCSMVMHYCDMMHQKLIDSGYYEQQGPFRYSDNMCVTVNNLEYVRRNLGEFKTEQIPANDPTIKMHETCLAVIENRCERIMSKLGPLMQSALQKVVFHLAWSPDSLAVNVAVGPLLEYLDNHLGALNSSLISKNFMRALRFVWKAVLAEMFRQMETGNDSDKPANFHKRLHDALLMLVEFFNAEDQGLSLEVLHCDDFWRLEQRLQYHKTETDMLIDMFYMGRLNDQMTMSLQSKFGYLAVRAYFNHDSLCVEVLKAYNIIPLDPNGFSDPFVIIELLPRRVFSHCMEQHTNVHKRTLNPVFDECFEFSVTLEQCLMDGAMIGFTVMDHDVLTANDFGGEAFLSLAAIPGVADYNASVDNFHGLKPFELPLMQQYDRNNPILQILELRINDKTAQDFVRKQKARFAS